jgi:sulfite reductase beta subunit-like hemoprotein
VGTREPEPLNANEQFKKDDDALNVRARIEEVYSKQGFDSIDKNDLRGRMRWMGLYTQREQGYDGTWTGDENADILEAKYFMMRVRCDGGALTAGLRTIGEISTEFARDTADISDRENVQYHWIRIEDVPQIWERLASVGLQTTEACGDCPRVVLGSPLAGESLDEVLDPTWAIDEIVRRWVATRRSPTCRASTRPPSVVCRTWPTRSTTSRSSASTIPSTGRAWISGSAAGCPPTRCSPNGSGPGCHSTRCPRCGRR